MPDPRKQGHWGLALVLAALFGWGVWELMRTPLESGSVYPPYSTLRTDPLGAKALFDSLSELPDVAVTRLYKQRGPLHPNTTLMILGVDAQSWVSLDEMSLVEYEKLIENGGRMVIAFTPTRMPRRTPPGVSRKNAIEEHWDLRARYRESPNGEDDSVIPRKSALYFDAGSGWTVLEGNDSGATVVERKFKEGTLLLVAESFPLSNQGLSEERDGAQIAKLIGPGHNIVFDENHFGVNEAGSVAVLLRKYRLENALGVLTMVAALFIWRNASSFLPPREMAEPKALTGRDSREGMTALLARSVAPGELLKTCWAQWSRSGQMNANNTRTERLRAEIELWSKADPAGKNIVEGYRAACRALTEKK